MSLEAEWKNAKKAFESAGGSKDTITGFEPACRAIDSAYSKLEAGKDDPKKREKAAKDFDAALVKLKAAERKVAKFTGISINLRGGETPKQALLKTASAIVKAAEKARTDLLG